ncbi:kinase-like domain-containing protein [Lentinula raphanica]|nr:kinase-like domain-containing protein [Lentinula raphanica]
MEVKKRNLDSWRNAGVDHESRLELWSPYRQFFQSHGYTLWNVSKHYGHVPPNDNPRAPDGFSYENEYSANAPSEFSIGSPLHFPARTTDNRDVMIAFLSDGVVVSNCVKVLRTIATGKNAGIDRNHALPLLHELRHDNMIFGVFPLVGTTFIGTWFVNIAHALEMMSQIMEGIAFLHDHLVAHRDLFFGNFLSSRRHGRWDPARKNDFLRPRYYIIDFEMAVQFSPDSDPATRMVTGPPLPWDIYRRPAPPEMKSDLPYCPFKADVWQVGKTFIALLLHIEHDIPDIIRLLRRMCDDNAEDRPSAREAVDQLNKIRNELPTETLQAPIEESWIDLDEPSNEQL